MRLLHSVCLSVPGERWWTGCGGGVGGARLQWSCCELPGAPPPAGGVLHPEEAAAPPDPAGRRWGRGGAGGRCCALPSAAPHGVQHSPKPVLGTSPARRAETVTRAIRESLPEIDGCCHVQRALSGYTALLTPHQRCKASNEEQMTSPSPSALRGAGWLPSSIMHLPARSDGPTAPVTAGALQPPRTGPRAPEHHARAKASLCLPSRNKG